MKAFNAIPSNNKELTVMKSVTHIGLYSSVDFQTQAGKRNAEFVRRHLVEQA